MLRFIIADDHTVVRAGLKKLLMEEFPTAFVDDVPDAEELIKKVIREKWDVVITDINMPGRSGLEALVQIKDIDPKLPVLVLSFYPESHYAVRAIKAGASGYLNKNMAAEELKIAVQKVLLGKRYISPTVAESIAGTLGFDNDKPDHEQLSNREFEVMKLLAAGKTVTEIADIYSISVNTVSTYKSRILVKMNMKTNADMTVYAMENGLI